MTTETSNARGEWVLVPRVPTEAMIGAFKQAHDEHAALRIPKVYAKGQREAANVVVGYRAMLAAAPPPAAARGDVRGLVDWLRKSAASCGTTEYGDGCRDAMNETADKLESALAAEGVQAGEVEQRARELLAAEYDRCGLSNEATSIRSNNHPFFPLQTAGFRTHDIDAALRAIASALSQQPEARGVVDEAMVERVAIAIYAAALGFSANVAREKWPSVEQKSRFTGPAQAAIDGGAS